MTMTTGINIEDRLLQIDLARDECGSMQKWLRDNGHEDGDATMMSMAVIARELLLAKENISGLAAALAQPQGERVVSEPRVEAVQGGWISVDKRLPKAGALVLAFYLNNLGKTRRVRAMWADKTTLPLGEDQDPWPGCYTDETLEEIFCEPGWYESNENEETHWRINDEVTHWMPLPEPPTPCMKPCKED